MRAPNPGDDTSPTGQTQPCRGPWRNTRASGKAGVARPPPESRYSPLPGAVRQEGGRVRTASGWVTA